MVESLLVTLILCLYLISHLFEAWSNSIFPVFPKKRKIFFQFSVFLSNNGKIIFKGTPEQAVNNEEVISVYLGNEAKLLKK